MWQKTVFISSYGLIFAKKNCGPFTVRILEPTRKHSYITVPSRSRLSSVEGGTHPSPFDSSASTLPNSSNKFSPSVAAENSGSTNKTNMLYRLAQAENLLTSSCRGFSTPFVHRLVGFVDCQVIL